MLTKRQQQLVTALCDRFDDGRYADDSFRIEHALTPQEIAPFFETVALLLRGVQRLPASRQIELLTLGTGAGPQVAWRSSEQARLSELTDQIRQAGNVP